MALIIVSFNTVFTGNGRKWLKKDAKGRVKKTVTAPIHSIPPSDEEDISDIELPILKGDEDVSLIGNREKGKGRHKTGILESDEDIFLDDETRNSDGEDETDISIINSRETGKNKTITIEDKDEDENLEDYTKLSWFWDDAQRLTDSWYRIEAVEDSSAATTTTTTTTSTTTTGGVDVAGVTICGCVANNTSNTTTGPTDTGASAGIVANISCATVTCHTDVPVVVTTDCDIAPNTTTTAPMDEPDCDSMFDTQTDAIMTTVCDGIDTNTACATVTDVLVTTPADVLVVTTDCDIQANTTTTAPTDEFDTQTDAIMATVGDGIDANTTCATVTRSTDILVVTTDCDIAANTTATVPTDESDHDSIFDTQTDGIMANVDNDDY